MSRGDDEKGSVRKKEERLEAQEGKRRWHVKKGKKRVCCGERGKEKRTQNRMGSRQCREKAVGFWAIWVLI